MATMYVYNIPTNETVNLRKTPSTKGTILVRVGYGKAVQANYYNSTWHSATYNGHSGYIMSEFLTSTDPNGGSGNTTGTINVGDTVITILPGVNFRSTPAGTSLFQVSTGTTMVVTAVTTSGGYTWYKGVISGKTGYLRGDCVEKYTGGSSGGTTSGITAGHYVKMNQSNSYPVNVRASTSRSSELLGQLQKGTLMYCEDVVTVNGNTWAKIRWGGQSATYAYIMTEFLTDGGIASSNKKLRAIAIANSMKNSGYPDQPEEYLDIGHGEWCVRYASFLMKAAGCSSGNYVPFSDALVSEAVTFFQNKKAFGTRANKTPAEGDWVFFSQGSETYQHVGLIVKVTGTDITTVEGNLNKTIVSRGPSSYNGKFGEMTVYGFGTPTWS